MQRFLIFILIVIAMCLALTRLLVVDVDVVDLVASTNAFGANTQKPVFNNGQIMLDISWSKLQLVYVYKILILLIIVMAAVLNYRTFLSEPSEPDEN